MRRALHRANAKRTVSVFNFELRQLPPEAEAFRDEVRAFIRTEMGDRPSVRRARSWGGYDPEFSRRLGARGWIGLTWPKLYGGQERSFLERYVLLEELHKRLTAVVLASKTSVTSIVGVGSIYRHARPSPQRDCASETSCQVDVSRSGNI